MKNDITIQQIDEATKRLKGVVSRTPLQKSKRLSTLFGANIYIKREDLQEVRSFKIRGAYNKISSLSDKDKKRGIVCASAGNHAQGVAYSCATLRIHSTIFMPQVTPQQKIEKVKQFGEKFVEIKLIGETYDDSCAAAQTYCREKDAVFVHPFDDPITIAGQGTIGKEIDEELSLHNSFTGGNLNDLIVIAPIGGGGLISGILSYFTQKNPRVKVIGVEPQGCPSMSESIKRGKVVTLKEIDTFVEGTAVKRVGDLPFIICKKHLKKIIIIPEGKVCNTMISLYQNEGIVAEPAGALAISAFDNLAAEIKGKTVVCILSGGNNDLMRYPEIMERSLVYQGRKHYFILQFTQKPGQLRQFVDKALGPNDDIVRFEYIKKTNKEKGAALVGIEQKDRLDFEPLLERMKTIGLNFRILSSEELLYDYLI